MLEAKEDDLPLFGEITHVIVTNVNQYYLITDVLHTVSFEAHYHAYKVEHNDTPTHHIVKPSSLIDYHPLGIYTCNNPHPTLFVSLKYHVISTCK